MCVYLSYLVVLLLASSVRVSSYLIDDEGKEIIPEQPKKEPMKIISAVGTDDDVFGPNALRDRPALANKKRWCHRDWPVTNGVWVNGAPFWTPNVNCPNRPFGAAEVKKCMKGRTMYTMGNSIGRQYAYGLVDMLGGAQVKREDQRDNCPKHETTWDDSCHSEYEGVKVKYLFMQYMDGFNYGPKTGRKGFPFYYADDEMEGAEAPKNTTTSNPNRKVSSRTHISEYNGKRLSRRKHASGDHAGKWGVTPSEFEGAGGVSFWESDSCIEQTTRNCFKRFFKDSTKDDILVFTLGMSYAHDKEVKTFDEKSWLKRSGINFKRHIEASFKGQVFWATMAPPNMNGYMASYADSFATANSILWNDAGWSTNMQSTGSEDRPWYTIDTWAINEGRYQFYQDHLHFNGALTHALLTQVFNELCPLEEEGKRKLEEKQP